MDAVHVVLHGGEPLLVGPVRLRRICAELTRALAPVTTLDLRIHTNGVRLNRDHLRVFDEFRVKVGISLGGDRVANDRHRLDRRGRRSYDRVLKAVELLRLPEHRHLYQGLLCTVDVANDPVAVHDALTSLDPPRIDYLLPHSTWDSPPPGHGPGAPATPYADWLLKVFDRWEEQGRPMPVRTFDSVLSTLRGGPSLTEALGLAPSDLAVIETDGTFEQADSLKTAYEGAPATGYDVFRHGFAEFAEHPGVRARQLGIAGVSETCRRCPVVESCGGGLYAHRYSGEKGFDNPSVFCSDLRGMVEGIAERITTRITVSDVAPASDVLPVAVAQATRQFGTRRPTRRRVRPRPGRGSVWPIRPIPMRIPTTEDRHDGSSGRTHHHLLLLQGRYGPHHGPGQRGVDPGRNGKRVLAVDWDLEAPGLDRFFQPFLDQSVLAFTTGVIDMITDCCWAATTGGPRTGPWHREYARVEQHAVSLSPERLGLAFPEGGSLGFLSAGRRNR